MRTHITLRLPSDLLEKIQSEAKQLDRSAAWVIADRLRVSYETYFQIVPRGTGLSPGNTAPLIALERCPNGENLRHEYENSLIGPTRLDNTQRGVSIEQARRFETNFAAAGCKSCGGLNGLHQKGCKA